MADRYQNRPFPAADDYDRGSYSDAAGKAESDPLAELARLIGQSDPFGSATKAALAPQPLQSRANIRPQPYQPLAEDEEEDAAPAPAGPPQWMQRARHEPAPPPLKHDYEEPQQAYQPSPVHPLHRYAAQPAQPAPEPDFREEDLPFHDNGHHSDPSHYDDALYGQLEGGEQDLQRDPAYPDDPYAYQGYEEEPEPRRRTSGLITVAAVLGLAVVGTGAAFAYRTYVGSPRTGEPPIIRADNTPTKVMPAQTDAPAKTPDRLASGDGMEKIVSREETPVDVNAKAGGPRVVFPPLNANANPPSIASVATAAPPPVTPPANGTLANGEPRKIRTLSVKGDASDAAAPPTTAKLPASATAAKPPAAHGNPASANASANTPLSIAPGGQPEQAPAALPTRVASTAPAPAAATSGGGYLVQVSSQRTEADAQASYRALQGKYGNVLGSQASVVKRVDLSDKGKGIVYRAFAGPFNSVEEATQVCSSLKAAGGPQCLIQRN
ncbi:SPOR domain-containing protein [Bradyrhizobium lablabi]|uniref:SPOR domain-containing protein n=1 Tax=Bradyrhizobium lablabi TaxID=722472 RepID=UPI001BAD6F28|nr:SPOR domain-containing protein [Bradyrhizobium lablabi]MBR0697438.1 SPOR domain-containing protein [Bradyrhizobium lablabi]